MRRMTLGVLAAAMVVGMMVMPAVGENDGTLGNGAPQAKLLGKLNIIGVANPKNANMDNDGGSVIFVNIDGHNKIGLVESGSADAPDVPADAFAVLDKNATDGNGALFALPDPDLDAYLVGDPAAGTDTDSAYSVFVRPLGKPGGWATITTCAELIENGIDDLLPGPVAAVLNKSGFFGGSASVEQVGQDILTREKGQSTFTNVTAELTTIVFMVWVDLGDLNGVQDEGEIFFVRVPIFDDAIQGEYWDYDDHGLKLCQVRFYNVSTDVAADDGGWNNLPEE